MKSFRENLREELDYQGMTVKELSARTGIIKGSLDNYLGARASIPPADVAVKIARTLNVSVEYLVTGEHPKEMSASDNARFVGLSSEFRAIPKNMQTIINDLIHAAAEISGTAKHG